MLTLLDDVTMWRKGIVLTHRGECSYWESDKSGCDCGSWAQNKAVHDAHRRLEDALPALVEIAHEASGLQLDWHAMKHSGDPRACVKGHCGRIRPLLKELNA